MPNDTHADVIALWSEPPAEGRPLVICLHGYAANEADLHGLSSMLGERPVFVSLRAPLRSDTPFEGYAWFELRMRRDGGLLGTGDTDDDREAAAAIDHDATIAAEYVFSWLDRVLAEGPTPSSIGLLGFSQGGIVASQMLRMRPDAFAATVMLCSMVAPGLHDGDARLAQHRPPLFVGWGGHDEIMPTEATEYTLDWAREATTVTEYGEPGAGHQVTHAQASAVAAFLEAHLPSA